MAISREEIGEIATRTADEVMERIIERQMLRDVIIGSAMGEGAIPLYGRETRKEPCHGCRIDPSKPLEAGNVMATTNNAIGTLAPDEVRNWCSEIIEVADGRCQRARTIKEAARECKEKHPEDTEAFFRCYIPAFSQITKGSNPTKEPWQMTKADFARKSLRDAFPEGSAEGKPFEQLTDKQAMATAEAYFVVTDTTMTHGRLVQKALSEGKLVPPEVLADYPTLLKGAK